MLKSRFILGLDIGTSSVRSAIHDREANIFKDTLVKNERHLTVTADGGSEIEPETAFSQVVSAIDGVLKKVGRIDGHIRYASTSSFWHSLMGIDQNGNPTTNVFSWAETRPGKYVGDLRKNLNEGEIHTRTGCHFHSSYWPAKLIWLKKERPDAFKATSKWISFPDYLALRILESNSEFGAGIPVTSVSMASGTGIFDIRKCRWDREILKYLEIKEEQLPRILEDDSDTFRLIDEFSNRWSELKDTKFYLAIGDGAANNIGAGCVSKDRAALMVGTSGAMRVAYEGEVPENIPNGLWCCRLDRKRIVVGGALSDGGGLYRWMKQHLGIENDQNMDETIANRPPDGHGITFLPFLSGERSTGYNEFASGSIIGLNHANDSVNIVQAALESVAYRFAEIYDRLSEVLAVNEIVASGGALHESPVWTQIICDTLGRNLYMPDITEASLRGAVLLAAEASGLVESIDDRSFSGGKNFEFSDENHKVYRAARKRHETYYRMLVNQSNL